MASSATSLGRDLFREATAGKKLRVGALLRQGAPVDFQASKQLGGYGSYNSSAYYLNYGSYSLSGMNPPLSSHTCNNVTPLMSSAENGHLDVVKLLAVKGANVHHRDDSKSTALLLAAHNNHLPVCLFLISLGADPISEDQSGRSALTSYGKGTNGRTSFLLDEARVATLKEARQAFLLHRPAKAFSGLLFSATFSDLVFVCPGDERIHAHRNIVAMCSSHMNALLQGPWAENAGGQASEVAIPQSAESVRALLKFMYTGEVEAAACTFHMMGVLDLASQHEQPELKERCEAAIFDFISVESVVSILSAAHLHNLKDLKAECFIFVEKNVAQLSLPELVGLDKFANKLVTPGLKAACERGAVAALTEDNAVSFLETALQLNLKLLKAKCIDLIASSTVLTLSEALVKLATAQPELWQDLRAAATMAQGLAGKGSKRKL